MHMSKRCVVSFGSKESFLHSNIMDQNIYTAGRSNIHVSKLVIKKIKKLCQDNSLNNRHTEDIPLENVPGSVLNFHPEFKTDLGNKQLFANSSVQRRKFEEIEKEKNEFQNGIFSSKFLNISDSSYVKEKNNWEQYTSIKPHAIKSYSSLLPSKHITPNLIDDGKFSHQIHSLSSLYRSNFCPSVHYNKSPSLNFTTNINYVSSDDTSSASLPYKNHKDEEMITGEMDSKSINNNCVSYDTNSAFFSTAAGKIIDVSETAMKAAHKLIHVFENEDKIMPSTFGICTENGNFKDIGCPSKKLLTEDYDDSMDKALLEKFFQDAFFDEKVSQNITESSKVKNLNEVFESKINNITTRKIRKSLGGRRSMRFYSRK